MNQFATILFLLIPLVQGFSQPAGFHLSGTLQDAETQKPVPYASLTITHSPRGTAAGEQGSFQLWINNEEINQYLVISSIGYKTRRLPLDSLKSTAPLKITLHPDIHLLKEVQVAVAPMNPKEILTTAIDSIAVNYMTEPFNLEFYSELTAENSVTGQKFMIESILLGYYPGYAHTAMKKFEILRKRSTGENPLSASDYPFWPTLELHRADELANPEKTGVLQKANLNQFQFTYHGVLPYDQDTVFHLSYVAPKPTKKLTGYGTVPQLYRGEIFITTTSHAIVAHEIETDQFSYKIHYRNYAGNYFPYLIQGTRRLHGENLFTTVNNLLRLTRIELTQVKEINARTNEFLPLDELPDDKAYWEIYYPEEKE